MAMGTPQDRSGNWECLSVEVVRNFACICMLHSVILQSLRSVYGLHTAHFRPVILWCDRVVRSRN